MASIASNLATKPRKIKTTVYFLPEVYDALRESKRATRTGEINATYLALARQKRQLPGVGPRAIPEFLGFVGIESDIPPEYQYTAKERELLRVEQAKMVGAPWTFPKVQELPALEVVQELPALEVVQELPALEVVQDVLCTKLLYLQTFPRPNTSNFHFCATAPHPDELEKRSRKLSALVKQAKEHCPKRLNLIAQAATPNTPTIDLETDLEAAVSLETLPALVPARKGSKWRNLS